LFFIVVKEYVVKIGGSSDGGINPFSRYAEVRPVPDGYLIIDARPLEGVACPTIGMDEVSLDY
jgi:hypothetical protein